MHAAPGGLQCRFDEFLDFAIVGPMILQRGQVADDDGEQIIEIVRESAGQLSDGLHFLCLDQRRLHALLLGDLVRKNEEAERFAVDGDFRDQRAAREDGMAVAFHLVLVGDLLAGQGLPDRVAYLAIDVPARSRRVPRVR